MLRVVVDTQDCTIEGTVDPCQDFDGRYIVVTDDGERLLITGWLSYLSFPDYDGFGIDQVLAGFTVPAV